MGNGTARDVLMWARSWGFGGERPLGSRRSRNLFPLVGP